MTNDNNVDMNFFLAHVDRSAWSSSGARVVKITVVADQLDGNCALPPAGCLAHQLAKFAGKQSRAWPGRRMPANVWLQIMDPKMFSFKGDFFANNLN